MHSSSPSKPIIYQVFTRLFGNKGHHNKPYGTIEENGVGKFNDFTNKALSAIKGMGFTHIWFTGILEHSQMTDYSSFGIKKDNPEVVKGKAGSPYAIKDYFDVDPDLAVDVENRMQEFEALVDRSHANRLKVIIDFVPNHVARAYASDVKPPDILDLGENDDPDIAFSAKNNFYYLPGQPFQVPEGYEPAGGEKVVTRENQTYQENPAKATGNDVFTAAPVLSDWFETVKINYGIDYQHGGNLHFDPIPDTWYKMKQILLFWAAKTVDGFRCDMAQMVPVAFWNWVIPAVKAEYPDLIFIAEIYDEHLYQEYIREGNFDFLYDKVTLYDTLRAIIERKASVNQISKILSQLEPLQSHMLRFLENHDEQRIASTLFAGDPFAAIPGMMICATAHRGPVMVYFGQEVGEPAIGNLGFSGDDGRTTIFDYTGVPEHQKWMNHGQFDGKLLSQDQVRLRNSYQQILYLSSNEPAIALGDFLDLYQYNQETSESIYYFIRKYQKSQILIIVNFSDHAQMAQIEFTNSLIEILQISQQLQFQDYFSNEIFEPNQKILKLEVMPFGYRALRLTNT